MKPTTAHANWLERGILPAIPVNLWRVSFPVVCQKWQGVLLVCTKLVCPEPRDWPQPAKAKAATRVKHQLGPRLKRRRFFELSPYVLDTFRYVPLLNVRKSSLYKVIACLSEELLLLTATDTLKNVIYTQIYVGEVCTHSHTPNFQDLSLNTRSIWFRYSGGCYLFEVLCGLRVGFECIILVCFSYYSNRVVIYSLLISGFKGWGFFF